MNTVPLEGPKIVSLAPKVSLPKQHLPTLKAKLNSYLHRNLNTSEENILPMLSSGSRFNSTSKYDLAETTA